MNKVCLGLLCVIFGVSCDTRTHVNSWDYQSPALDAVGMTAKKQLAKQKAEQALYKPGEMINFRNSKFMVFEQNPETGFSTSGTIKQNIAQAQVLVAGELFAKVKFADGSQGFVNISDIVNPQDLVPPTEEMSMDIPSPAGTVAPNIESTLTNVPLPQSSVSQSSDMEH